MCYRTKTTPWTGGGLTWSLLVENGINWPESVLELE